MVSVAYPSPWFMVSVAVPVEAQVPLAQHVCGVAGLLQPLGQGTEVGGQAAGLAGPDDGVLEASVDLVPEGARARGGSPRGGCLDVYVYVCVCVCV